jgi:hypothetical protein
MPSPLTSLSTLIYLYTYTCTFIYAFQEDTLACILALDGFYLENRNIRASYGTSKYCSAFIKNVRCNNPECTYLHEMGAVEDTFTKQEIQAGYVTSGRDVLARQQQIVQQALSASSAGMAGTAPRRKVGGGGPSGTGKGAVNPVFPAPEFDEPTKPAPMIPAPSGMARAATLGTGFPTVPAGAQQQTVAKPMSRSTSVGASNKASVAVALPATRKGILANASNTDAPPAQAQQPATAASVVAGVHSVSGGIGTAPSPHTTLTPLTPLKRASKASTAKSATAITDTISLSMPTISNNYSKPTKTAIQRVGVASRGNIVASASAPCTPPSDGLSDKIASTLTALNRSDEQPSSLSSLGGEVIAAPERSKLPVPVGAIGSPFNASSRSGSAIGSSALNGPDGLRSDIIGGWPVGLSGLGGEVFTGPLSSPGPKSAIGSGKDKWGSNQTSVNASLSQPIGPPAGLWGAVSHGGSASLQGISAGSPDVGIGGGVIVSPISNHTMSTGGSFGAAPGPHNSGSNALASILGINLPTGSGSLRESPNLWPLHTVQQPQQHASLSSLHGSPVPSQGIIGRSTGSSGLIGGVPIGGNIIGFGGTGLIMNQPGAVGSSNKNDIALLQSLLPEVHITSGNGASQNGWNSGRGQHHPVGVGAVGRPQQAQSQGAAANLNIW